MDNNMERVFYLYFGIVLALLSPALPLSGAILILSIIMIPFFPERSHRDRRITERLIQPTACPQRVKLLFPACFLIVALGSSLYWLAYFPGGYNLDASGQMLQAHHMLEYSDWHPIFSTLLIQLCTAICDRFEFCILVQILAFALAMAHLLTTLNGYGVPAKLTLMVTVFTALNPAIGLNTVSMTKDVQFTGFLVFMMTMLIHIYHTDADWLFRPAHWLCLGLVSACICLVRHNGVLIVIPALLLLIWRYRSCAKAVVCAAMVCAVCVGIIKGPVSQKLNVEPHDNPVGEMIGIPMAIMANALVYAPEQLPEDVHNFLNTIADDMSWEENYYTGEWDSCKWILTGVDNIKSVPLSQILRYTLSNH